MNAAIRALNGFGLGARPGERRRMTDPRNWLRRQLDGEAPLLAAPAASSPERITALSRSRKLSSTAFLIHWWVVHWPTASRVATRSEPSSRPAITCSTASTTSRGADFAE